MQPCMHPAAHLHEQLVVQADLVVQLPQLVSSEAHLRVRALTRGLARPMLALLPLLCLALLAWMLARVVAQMLPLLCLLRCQRQLLVRGCEDQGVGIGKACSRQLLLQQLLRVLLLLLLLLLQRRAIQQPATAQRPLSNVMHADLASARLSSSSTTSTCCCSNAGDLPQRCCSHASHRCALHSCVYCRCLRKQGVGVWSSSCGVLLSPGRCYGDHGPQRGLRP
jgi:hypothetical protein